jgi:spermidine synthase
MSVFLNLRQDGSMALFIDGDLQFDQRDEKIYHQGLALPALHLASGRVDKQKDLRALIVGGGDGLTARELLKSQSLTKIDLVDYSAEVLDLAGKQLAHINQMSLADERVNVHMRDAWLFVQEALEQGAQYDLIIVDLTVAKDAVGSKFHSVDWYRSIALLLASDGILATNGVSPTNTPLAYWSIFNSMLKAGLVGLPYRLAIPSFSQLGYGPDWGFILASKTPINGDEFIQWSEHQARSGSGSVLDNMFANQSQLESLFLFPIDFVKLQK